MKNLLFLVIIILASYSISFPNAYESAQTGEWSESSTWGDTWDAPVVEIRNQNSFKKTMNINVGHVVSHSGTITFSNNNFVLNVYGELNLGEIITNNNITIKVFQGGVINIAGNVEINNNLTIEVEEGAQFNIEGQLDLKNNAAIVIDGELSVDNIEGGNNNSLTGTGVVYLPNPDSHPGIDEGKFEGIIVYGETMLSLTFPQDLYGNVINGSTNPEVDLYWQFDFTEANRHDGYNFESFQVFRYNGENNTPYLATAIAGVIDESGPNITDPFIVTNYKDNNGLTPQSTPKYYVRAIYSRTSEDKNISYVFSRISNIVDFTNSPLPVELLSFHAMSKDGYVQLTWTTATETNNMGFEVQRFDEFMQEWQAIGFVDGNYNHIGILSYQFNDEMPFDGVNYYQLKQMDYDGKFEFLGPVAAHISASSDSFEISVFKTSYHNVFIQLPANETGKLVVYDLQGRLLYSGTSTGIIDLNLNQGVYIASFSNGVNSASVKFAM